MSESILIVDDEQAICRLCAHEAKKAGLEAEWTVSPKEALKRLEQKPFDLLVTDIKMPGMDGITLMQEARKARPDLPVIIMTAYASFDIVLKALKQGANNFLNKPFHKDEFVFTVKNELEKQRLLQENMRLKTLVNLIQVSDKIVTVHDPEKIYSLLMDAAARETGATRGKIYQFDEQSHRLQLEYEWSANGYSGELPDLEEETVWKRIEQAGEMVSSQAIAIPLHTQNKFLGLLSLFNDNGHQFSQIDVDVAKILASQAAIALENGELLCEIENLFLETIKSLASTLDEKDPYTHGHSQRVSQIAVEVGQRMGLKKSELETLALAGSLHDIGKIGIPDKILQKSGQLTPEEFEIIKTHPEKGAKILSHIRRLKDVVEAVYTHHEWYNGQGYPRGLKGDEIPISGAIINLADALDTITTDRPYQKRKPPEVAYEIIRKSSGKQFHPRVVEAALAAPLETLKRFTAGS